MSTTTPYLILTCSDRGSHDAVMLARVTCLAGPALRGQALADYNAGKGPYAGHPLTVDVTTNPTPPPDGQPYKWTSTVPDDRLEVTFRRDGKRVWVVRCNVCGRAPKLSESVMRKLGQIRDTNVFDLSNGPW